MDLKVGDVIRFKPDAQLRSEGFQWSWTYKRWEKDGFYINEHERRSLSGGTVVRVNKDRVEVKAITWSSHTEDLNRKWVELFFVAETSMGSQSRKCDCGAKYTSLPQIHSDWCSVSCQSTPREDVESESSLTPFLIPPGYQWP